MIMILVLPIALNKEKMGYQPKNSLFAPLAFCTEGPNQYDTMVLALLWVCVSNMHSIILVEGLGAKMDLLGF
jgi:hypothetical protein